MISLAVIMLSKYAVMMGLSQCGEIIGELMVTRCLVVIIKQNQRILSDVLSLKRMERQANGQGKSTFSRIGWDETRGDFLQLQLQFCHHHQGAWNVNDQRLLPARERSLINVDREQNLLF